MTVTFAVPGDPQGKGRPRFTRSGHVYTDKKTKDYERTIRLCYKFNHSEVFEGPVSVKITALFPIPKSERKSSKAEMAAGHIRPKTKPDGDNIEKAVLDALNGVAYGDDRQVVSCTWEKWYGCDEQQVGLIVTISDEDRKND